MNITPSFDLTSLRSNLPDPDSNSTRSIKVQNQNKRTTSVTRFDEAECATSTTSNTPESLKLHSDYLRNILSFLNKKDARSLNLVSKCLNNEVNQILNKTHCPKILPDNITLKGFDMQKEAKEIPSTQRLVNDAGQWDAEFIIHCLKKTKNNKSYERYINNKESIICYAAELGDLTLLNLLKQHNLYHSEGVGVRNRYNMHALGLASKFGHVDVLHFLKNNDPLRDAAKNGHVDILRFLRSSNPLIDAAKNGHVDVLHVLKDKFGFNDWDARTWNNYALSKASENGHLNVIRVLKNKFGLTTDDAKSNDNKALRNAYQNEHIKVVEFFDKEWGLTLS